ncbi:MAG: hypothetical protein NTU66_06075 [Elusimicrobia bacterium]|nr:hypothetical protein [Elusimicrobiota bacterium]
MKTKKKNETKKMFSTYVEIAKAYFPAESKEQLEASKERVAPGQLGEYFATKKLESIKL